MPLVRTLLAHKADVRAPEDKGWTALHLAANAGEFPLVETLLMAKADPAQEDLKRRRPALFAKVGKHREVEAYLLQAAAERDDGELPPEK